MRIFDQWPGDERLYRNLQEALCKSNIEEEWIAYKKKRAGYMRLGVLGFLCAMALLVLICFYKIPLNSDSVERPGYGQDDGFYDFYAEDADGEEESIHLDISARSYTEEEAEEHFDACYKALYETIRGSNPSYEEISESLDFSDIEGYEDITLSFYTSDADLIGDDGILNPDGFEPGTYEISIYIQMLCGSFQKNYEIPARVCVSEDSAGLSSYLLEMEKKTGTDQNIKLPGEYKGNTYFYYTKIPWTTGAGAVSIICVILIYLFYGQQARVKETCKKRRNQLEAAYPMLLSRLMILTRAGMSMKKAWFKIIADYERHEEENNYYVMAEMILTRQEIERGISEKEAYLRFGQRCGLPCYIKLGSILEQNLRKGTQGLMGLLESERMLALENRKQQVKAAGEIAGSKLMMPMMVLFALIMAIVMVPALMSFNM